MDWRGGNRTRLSPHPPVCCKSARIRGPLAGHSVQPQSTLTHFWWRVHVSYAHKDLKEVPAVEDYTRDGEEDIFPHFSGKNLFKVLIRPTTFTLWCNENVFPSWGMKYDCGQCHVSGEIWNAQKVPGLVPAAVPCHDWIAVSAMRPDTLHHRCHPPDQWTALFGNNPTVGGHRVATHNMHLSALLQVHTFFTFNNCSFPTTAKFLFSACHTMSIFRLLSTSSDHIAWSL